MNTIKFKLICVIVLVNYTIAKRISELKCDELSLLQTDSRSLHPYLMEVVRVNTGELIVNCPVTLISDDFVLTNVQCVDFWLLHKDQIRIRKVKLPDEEYEDSQLFSVKNLIRHELYNPLVYSKYDIGLIQLNEKITYHNTTSIYRPACLWTNTLNPPDSYLLYGLDLQNTNVTVAVKQFPTTTYDECTKRFGFTTEQLSGTRNSHVCFNTNLEFLTKKGAAIIVKARRQNYVFGIITHTNQQKNIMSLGSQLNNDVIGFIERTVWPNHTELECGQRIVAHKPFLTYAQPSYHGEFPWHVALYRNNQRYICGGTIINSRTILTAAHCVQDERGVLPTNRLTIVAGTYSLSDYPIEAQNYGVRTIKVHENYNRHYLENDIALVKLKGIIEFSNYIQPICMSNTLDYSNVTMGTVAGWGRTENNQPSDVLLQATLPIRDNFECRDSNRIFFPNYLNENNFCAGYNNGTNVCSGDSGGGMIFEYNSRWYIRGLVSLGVAVTNSDRCDVTQFVLFTDVPKFYDWIDSNSQDD